MRSQVSKLTQLLTITQTHKVPFQLATLRSQYSAIEDQQPKLSQPAPPVAEIPEQTGGFGGFEEDDGWGSPEPGTAAAVVVKDETEAVVVEAKVEEDDGWGGWGDTQQETNEQVIFF